MAVVRCLLRCHNLCALREKFVGLSIKSVRCYSEDGRREVDSRQSNEDLPKFVKLFVKKVDRSLSPNDDHGDFALVYKYPNMNFTAAMTKLAVYQTVLCAGMSPMLFHLFTSGEISPLAAGSIAAIASLACVGLLSYCYNTRHRVGYMWAKRNATEIKIAYLSHFARRKDATYPITSIAEVGDLTKPYFPLHLNNPNLTCFLSLKHGHVINEGLFYKAFGKEQTLSA